MGDAVSLGRGVALVVGGAALGLLSLLGGGEASVIGSAHVMVEAGLKFSQYLMVIDTTLLVGFLEILLKKLFVLVA